MEILFEHKYIRIEWYDEIKFIKNVWYTATDDMTDKEYREIAEVQTRFIEDYKPILWLVSLSELGFVVVPETQTWADSTLFPRIIAAGVKYIAFVVSPNIFAHVAVEQLMEEETTKNADFHVKYFETDITAVNWLKSNLKP